MMVVMIAGVSGGDDQARELAAAARMGRGGGVRWVGIDRALAGFTAESLLAVVGAALDSPWCRPWGVPPVAGGRGACVGGRLAGRPRGPRTWLALCPQRCGQHLDGAFSVAGRRWRVHPGDVEHPLMLLRRIAVTAGDSAVMGAMGFTLTDVLEVILAHGYRTVQALARRGLPPVKTAGDRRWPAGWGAGLSRVERVSCCAHNELL